MGGVPVITIQNSDLGWPGLDEAIALAGFRFEHRSFEDPALSGFYTDPESEAAVQALVDSYDPLPFVVKTKLADISTARWSVMVGGHTTSAGIPSKTDTQAIALITGLWNVAQLAPTSTFQFTDREGTIRNLGHDAVRDLFVDVSVFVQACFSRGAELTSQVTAPVTPWQTIWAIDVTVGFPANT